METDHKVFYAIILALPLNECKIARSVASDLGLYCLLYRNDKVF